MQENPKRIFATMAARVCSRPFGEYLQSEDFSGFVREHDLDEVWEVALETSRDTPDLYGRAAIRNAFVTFLQHACHRDPEGFPGTVAGLLAAFSLWSGRTLPLRDLKNDLADLGYPDTVLEREFPVLRSPDNETAKPGIRD